MFVPTNRSELYKENAKKNVVVFCYLLAGLRNKLINSLQLEIGLYLSSSGATVESIDLLSKIGISVSYCEIVEERLNKTVLCRSIGTNLLRKSRDDHQIISKLYSKVCVTCCATHCVAQNKLVLHQVPIIFNIYNLFLFLYFIYYLLYWSYIKG